MHYLLTSATATASSTNQTREIASAQAPMNTTAMEQIAKYYWGMRGPSRAVVGTTTTRLRSTWPPAPPAHGCGEPSWEEQAFARDAAGHLGGCVWPPRSYTCSFCRREFRSAQALGGHMNVHRRDRARLRQCASPDHDAVQDTQQQQPGLQPDQHLQADSPSLYPSPCPKSTGDLPLNKDQVMISSSTSPSYISTIIKESKKEVFISMPTATAREAAESDGEEERRKRRRVDQPPAVVLPFFVRPSASCERVDPDAKVPKAIASPSSTSLHLVGPQEVDLELRLGSSPIA